MEGVQKKKRHDINFDELNQTIKNLHKIFSNATNEGSLLFLL
jgi:hypothetical protein